VFLQLFNLINARKIELGEFNVFSGFFNNPLFLIIMLFTIAIQILLVKFGGKAVKTYPLDMNRNFICIGIGSLSLIWGLIVKTLPLKMFQCIKLDETPMEEEELSLPQALKKSATIRKGSTVKSNPKTPI
jgi:Ca2+ transporting ATPase